MYAKRLVHYSMREIQKRGRKFGQAQENRRRDVPHGKAEIIYRDWDRGGRINTAGRNSRSCRVNRDSRQYAVSGNNRHYRDDGRNQAGRSGSNCNNRRRRARKRQVYLARMIAAFLLTLFFVLIYLLTGVIYRLAHHDTEQPRDDTVKEQIESIPDEVVEERVALPAIKKEYLEINDYSRPGTELEDVKSIFVNYTANPGTSAAQNRSYFSNLARTHETSASAHLIIGYEGEIVQCIPFEEQAYAVMTRNNDSISIECCYVSDDGSFTQETYDTLAWLIDKYDLTADDILRHFDCGGKKCPKYYVEHEGAWERPLCDGLTYKDKVHTVITLKHNSVLLSNLLNTHNL